MSPPEDLEREPDGVPHDIVARTAFASCLIAAVALALFMWMGWVGALMAAAVAVPIMVLALQRKSARERDPVHPSR